MLNMFATYVTDLVYKVTEALVVPIMLPSVVIELFISMCLKMLCVAYFL
jgi:hypothetical protein